MDSGYPKARRPSSSSFLSHESFAAPLISPPFPLLGNGNGCELCTVDTVLNKADNSNNKERNARITFSLRERRGQGGMDGGTEEEKTKGACCIRIGMCVNRVLAACKSAFHFTIRQEGRSMCLCMCV